MTGDAPDRDHDGTIDCTPRLPACWRDDLANIRRKGYPNSPQHQWAYRNFVRQCFPDCVDTTDPDELDQLEAWWVLTQLRHEIWRYWLTAPSDDVHQEE